MLHVIVLLCVIVLLAGAPAAGQTAPPTTPEQRAAAYDEYRVVSDSGETIYVTTTIRNYNAFADRWDLLGMDRGNGLQDAGTAQRDGGEMRLEQRFGVAAGGTPAILRIRYHDIRPDRFSWTADRSTDGGKTWVSPFQTIEARRIGAASSMRPLAPTGKPGAPIR